MLKDKAYTHFDRRTRGQAYEELVSDPEWVGRHGFYPFVHCEMKRGKYSKEKGFVPKSRELFYAAHVDGFIYQHYGKMLNEKYNEYARKLGIDENSIAYRNCWPGKCNIDFAREVFEFINAQESAYVYVTDLTDFFGTLDHKYLKGQLKKVLGAASLDGGNYAVFKSITKCVYVDLKDIAVETGLSIKELGEHDRFFETKEFRDLKGKLLKHWEGPGIPQGTAVSAVYANIYMTDFDKAMAEYAARMNGLYRRYCDDVIIVLPMSREALERHVREVETYIAGCQKMIPGVKINEEKTEHYFFEDQTICSLEGRDEAGKDENGKGEAGRDEAGQKVKRKLSYLGFDFDGKRVRIRGKSIFKFYYRAYRKIKRVNESYEDDPGKFMAGKKAVYNGYTHLYSPRHVKDGQKAHGNFYTYARRADAEFSKSERLESEIRRQVRRHWKKIRGRLK